MEISEDTLPIIFVPGLCQLYYIDINNTNYINLSKNIYNILNQNEKGKNFLEQMSTIIENFVKESSYFSYNDFKQKLFSSEINFEDIIEILSDFLKNNVSYIHKEQIQTVKSLKVNIYNENHFNLLIDEFCLYNFQKKNDITFEFYTQDELLSEIDENKNIINNYLINNKKIFFFSNSADILKLFKNKYSNNFFTFLIGIYLFNYIDKKEGSEEQKIVNNIVNYFESELNNNNIYKDSGYIINSDVNFLIFNFYYMDYYYKEIILKNISTYKELIKYFEDLKPKVILVFVKNLLRSESFVKQRFFICNGEILYKPHYGLLNSKCNGKVDGVLSKATEMKDFEEYNDIFEFLKNYDSPNDIQNLLFFVDKNAQSIYLKKFCSLINNNDLNKDYEFKLLIVNDLKFDIEDLKNKQKFLDTLSLKKFKFPIIVKYTSNNNYFKHQMSIIENENSYNKFIDEYINKIDNVGYKTTCLIQQIINHGGYVLKIYYLGGKIYIDYRSSTVNIDEKNTELIEELFQDRGYWNFKTSDLENKNYKENIWEKYVQKDYVVNLVEGNQKLKDYLYHITYLFEVYSQMSLFGIDILIDYDEKKLFIIDSNSFPGFKKGFNVQNDLREFFKKYLDNN